VYESSGVVGQVDEGQRISVQNVTSLSKTIRLCSYIVTLFIQSESHNNGSIPQLSAWCPVLDRAVV
jgi:hypothetical protein